MNTEKSVDDALILLEQMSEDPNVVLQVMDETEQYGVMKEFDKLAEQAASIRSSADLLDLADAIHRLVEDQEGLRALLLTEGTDVAEERLQRMVTIQDQQATSQMNSYIQQRAPQIRNAVIECREQLKAALQEQTDSAHKPQQGTSHDRSQP